MIIFRMKVRHTWIYLNKSINMKTLTLHCKSCIIGFLPAVLFLVISMKSFSQENLLIQQGHFSVGCNYWASHAGTHMWRDWRPEIIEQDFKLLSENGIRVLRVFPLWPDFQPICQIYSSGGSKSS
ncbi:MAG: hypothetical protein IPN67_01550 [Bacteroidales bacterium]|nr:hypothetical protein [Bacteroidales bacterium]